MRYNAPGAFFMAQSIRGGVLAFGGLRRVPGALRVHSRSLHLKGNAMLELRPSCENCNTLLPPASLEARICSYECTFCADCVLDVLHDVCPNCGGGFVPRPIRPSRNWKDGNFLGKDPAGTKVTFKPVDPDAFAEFAAPIRDVAPDRR
jgi:hypothetical protein